MFQLSAYKIMRHQVLEKQVQVQPPPQCSLGFNSHGFNYTQIWRVSCPYLPYLLTFCWVGEGKTLNIGSLLSTISHIHGG